MGLEGYLNFEHGILNGQYLALFILSFNPFVFRLFERRHFVFLLVSVLLSFFSHRAVLPFMLLILLDLDYSKLDRSLKQKMLYMFLFAVGIISIFGAGWQ